MGIGEVVVTITLKVLVTAYAPNSGVAINGGVRTATGEYISEAIVACGPRFLGWFVLLDGVYYLCGDRGGAVGNNHVDRSFVLGSAKERLHKAFQWGRRYRTVTFYKPTSRNYKQLIRQIRPVYQRCFRMC